MTRRRQAKKRGGSAASGSFLSFGAGLICGLVLATVAWLAGWLPGAPGEQQAAAPSGRDEPPIAEQPAEKTGRAYDFFTVLPEREVVIPREEIAKRARERSDQAASQGPYVLQAGSFRDESDADGLRARLILLGLDVRTQSVTVDGDTWHRVRVGPYESAREADAARRRLQENGHDAIVLRDG